MEKRFRRILERAKSEVMAEMEKMSPEERTPSFCGWGTNVTSAH